MDRIKTTPEGLMRLSTKLGGAADSITNNLVIINKLMDELNHSWESNVSITYVEKIRSEMVHSENLVQTLMALSETLIELTQAYQAVESDMTSKIADMLNKNTFT